MTGYGSYVNSGPGDGANDSLSSETLPLHDAPNSYFHPLTRRSTSPAHRLQRHNDIIRSSIRRRLSFITPPAAAVDSSVARTTSLSSQSSFSRQQDEAHDVFQNAIRLALAAYEYGCVGYRIEAFLERLLLDHGYECSIMVTNVELIASVYSYRWRKKEKTRKTEKATGTKKIPATSNGEQQDGEDNEQGKEQIEIFLPITIAVPLRDGANLFKLGELSVVCHNVKYKQCSQSQAMERLEEIDSLSPPYNMVTRWLAYVGTSIGFVAILGGSWIDLYTSIAGSSMTFGVVQIFATFCTQDTVQRLHVTWQNFFAAFCPSLLAAMVSRISLFQSSINVITITVSCVISEVPGFMLLKSISELSRNRILAGFGHFIGALFISFWLGLGGWVGIELVKIAFGPTTAIEHGDDAPPIKNIWLFLFGPILCASFAIFFNVGRQDLVPATFVGLVALGMTLMIPLFPNAMFGNFLSAFATSVASHLWSYFAHPRVEYQPCSNGQSQQPHKPESIFGLPAFFTLCCGSMGFLGFLGLLEGDSSTGTHAFEKMLAFTFILVFGVYVGGTVFPTRAVLNAW